jgi:hypothetical protein
MLNRFIILAHRLLHRFSRMEDEMIVNLDEELYQLLKNTQMTEEFITTVMHGKNYYTNTTGSDDGYFEFIYSVLNDIISGLFADRPNVSEPIINQHSVNGGNFDLMRQQVKDIYNAEEKVLHNHCLIIPCMSS